LTTRVKYVAGQLKVNLGWFLERFCEGLNGINYLYEYQMIYLSETSGRALPDIPESWDPTLILYGKEVSDDLQTNHLKSNFKEVEEDIRKMLDINK